jgi:hypothetical protein
VCVREGYWDEVVVRDTPARHPRHDRDRDDIVVRFDEEDLRDAGWDDREDHWRERERRIARERELEDERAEARAQGRGRGYYDREPDRRDTRDRGERYR